MKPFDEAFEEAPTRELSEGPSVSEEAVSYAALPQDLSEAEGFPCFIELLTGAITPVKTSIFVAGFSKQCGLRIVQDPMTHTVSRFHATVEALPEGMYLTDESLNGTFFGSDPSKPESFVRLPKGSRVQLKDGQFVRFADVLYQYRSGERMPL